MLLTSLPRSSSSLFLEVSGILFVMPSLLVGVIKVKMDLLFYFHSSTDPTKGYHDCSERSLSDILNPLKEYCLGRRIEMDLFTFIRHADPTKGRVIPLANEDDHADRAGQDEEATIVLYEEFQAAVADKPKGTRKKRKAAGGASGSNLPPKKLKEDHGTSGDAGASTAGKSLVALQGLLECSTLAMEIEILEDVTICQLCDGNPSLSEESSELYAASVIYSRALKMIESSLGEKV
ncbi:hypothetical protein Tco_0320952 [Tanacetum coccineum]